MTPTPLAHAGHWITDVLTVLPVAVAIFALWFSSWRAKRRGPNAADVPPPAA